jgi:Short C-terminal domain
MKRAILVIAMIVILAAGCTKAGIQETVVHEVGRDYVYLVHETDKAGNIVPADFDHPANLSPEEVDTLLTSVTYAEYSFFKWRGDDAVFVESERKKLSESVAKALAAADSDHWVKFAVTAKKRDMFLPTRRLTDGFAFVKNGRFHLVLSNLNFELADTEKPYTGDPRARFSLGALRLNEGDGMSHSAVDPADPFLKRPHNNWIVLQIKQVLDEPAETKIVEKPVVPDTAPAVAAVEGNADQPAEKPKEKSIADRLEELKMLLDSGLINQEDFDLKKAELLKEL